MYVEDYLKVEKAEAAIIKFLKIVIEIVGANNVLQMLTDNATNCKTTGREIEKIYKHIFW